MENNKTQPVKFEIIKGEIDDSDLPISCTVEPGQDLYGFADWQIASLLSTYEEIPPRCYTKIWFKVTYEDGQTYEGRVDVTAENLANPQAGIIRPHMIQHLEFHAGRWIPSHMSEADAAGILSLLKPEQIQEHADFLDRYAIRAEEIQAPAVVGSALQMELF